MAKAFAKNKKENITITVLNSKSNKKMIIWKAIDATGAQIIVTVSNPAKSPLKEIANWLGQLDMPQLRARAVLDSEESNAVIMMTEPKSN